MDEIRAGFEITQYIVIKVGQEQYGIDIKYIDNIVRMQHITRVPKVPEYLKGVINLRGEVLPVLSLRLKMDLPEDELTKATRIIILRVDGFEKAGIIVDEVKEVITLEDSQVDKMTYDGKGDKVNFVLGIGKVGAELVSLLDLNAVLNEKENA